MNITQEQADDFLKEDIKIYSQCVEEEVDSIELKSTLLKVTLENSKNYD